MKQSRHSHTIHVCSPQTLSSQELFVQLFRPLLQSAFSKAFCHSLTSRSLSLHILECQQYCDILEHQHKIDMSGVASKQGTLISWLCYALLMQDPTTARGEDCYSSSVDVYHLAYVHRPLRNSYYPYHEAVVQARQHAVTACQACILGRMCMDLMISQ